MDFQLKTLSIAQAATEKADALIVLVAAGTSSAKDALAPWPPRPARPATCPKAGKLLRCTGRPASRAARVCWRRWGMARAAVRTAVLAAVNAAKGASPKRVAIVFAGAPDAASLASAVLLGRRQLCLHQDQVQARTAHDPPADRGRGGRGSVARGLRPGHGDGRRGRTGQGMGQPARQLLHAHDAGRCREEAGRAAERKCEVLGPKEVAKLGMGCLRSRCRKARPSRCASSCCATTAPPRTRRPWCWSARASPSTPAASRSSPPPRWTR